MMISEVFNLDELKKGLPELPWQRRERYLNEFGLKEHDAESFVGNVELGNFFERVINAEKSGTDAEKTGKENNKEFAKLASNFIASDLVGLMTKDSSLKLPDEKKFAKIVLMNSEGKLSSRSAKDLITRIVSEDIDPEAVAEKEGLIQHSDEGQIKEILEKLIAENPKVVADYRGGKEASLQFFVGQAIKATKGSANPQIVKKVLLEILK